MSTRDINLLPKLKSAFTEENWNELLNLLNPKLFRTFGTEKLIAFPVLAKVAQILTTEDSVIPNNIKIACLKCIGNSCFIDYLDKRYDPINIEKGKYSYKLYSILANNENLEEINSSSPYPFDSYFPYEGVIEWTLNFITSCKLNSQLEDESIEILRLSIQFLCNLFSFAYRSSNFPDQCNAPAFLYDVDLKNAIIGFMHSEHIPLARSSCAFIYNALRKFEGESFSEEEKKYLCSQLLKPIKEGFQSPQEALILLLSEKNMLKNIYDDMTTENKLCLLELIYTELSDSVNKCKEEYTFKKDTIEFLIERFCKKSDIILQKMDTYTDKLEVTEIVILLDILATLTSRSCKEYDFLQDNKSLLINCTYLLKSIQMIGKQSNNYFTPLQKLSEIALAVQGITDDESGTCSNDGEIQTDENKLSLAMDDIKRNPTFGVKSSLVRIIGNMSYKNKEYQDLLRELDVIPLLLDCCNIDARNLLITQWTTLALRNLCEDNPANQEIIRNCSRVGVVESSVLQEMGISLHEDEHGNKIGIVPLPRERK